MWLNGPGIESRWRRYFSIPSRPVLGTTRPPIQWVLGLPPRRKADRVWRWPTTPSSDKFKESVELYLYSPLWAFVAYSGLTFTYSMVQSPSWEANWFAASQEIPRISRNPKVHYRTHKHPPTVSILCQPNPVNIPTSHLLEIHPNIIHPSKPRSPQWSPSLRFPHQDSIHPLSSPIRATCPAHLILLDFITRTILGEDYKSFSSSLCSPLHSPVTSSLLGPNILLNTMFSNNLSFLSSRNVNDQVSHPCKTTGKIIVLYIFIFKFLDSNPEDKRFCTEW